MLTGAPQKPKRGTANSGIYGYEFCLILSLPKHPKGLKM